MIEVKLMKLRFHQRVYNMKYIFFGTDDFSVAILEKLMSDFYFPVAVVTMPDKPVGRKQVMTAPAVKSVCEHHNLPYFQPEKLTEIKDELVKLEADYFIVASYGKIIPQSILELPKSGAINVHTSLLPEYRGPSPIQQAILDQKEQSGITLMMMDAEMDHGAILHQQSVDLADAETYRSLHSKLAQLGADTLAKCLPDIVKGKLKPKAQDDSIATYTKIIQKSDAQIDWTKSAKEIDAHIRGYFDWPIAWTTLEDGKRLKVIQAQPGQTDKEVQPGLLFFEDKQVKVACGSGVIEITMLQVEGKKEMDAETFITGYGRLDGTKLG